ncbi:MAG: hypothetical protein U1E76_24040 [Planctomycetota bacterium]
MPAPTVIGATSPRTVAWNQIETPLPSMTCAATVALLATSAPPHGSMRDRLWSVMARAG